MIPSTVDRVPMHTAAHVNQRIRRQMEERVAQIIAQGPTAIARRLEELDQEWDIERMLEANAATASLIGVALGASVDKRFFVLPALVAGFLLQHAVQGWCPPMPIMRRYGFRTQPEIDQEKYALKAARGDFRQINGIPSNSGDHRAHESLAAVQS